MNVLTPEQQTTIWSPEVIFINTQNQLKSAMADATVKILPNTNFTVTKFKETSAINIYLFSGAEHILEMVEVYNVYFICEYNMLLYPFDSQHCSLDIILTPIMDNFCSLNVDQFSFTGPADLTQYFIKNKTMFIQSLGNQRGIRVEIGLGRRLLSVLLTVFLPYLLLNIVGHASVYFPRFFYEAIITMNLTVMLVLTTMFIGVSNALPKTAYIKMVDIWFIFSMTVPFIEVLLQTYIEHLRCQISHRVKINYHGQNRMITVAEPVDHQTTSLKGQGLPLQLYITLHSFMTLV